MAVALGDEFALLGVLGLWLIPGFLKTSLHSGPVFQWMIFHFWIVVADFGAAVVVGVVVVVVVASVVVLQQTILQGLEEGWWLPQMMF